MKKQQGAELITGTITLVIKGKTLTVPLTYNGTNDNGHWHYVTMPDIRKGKTTFVQTIRVPDTLVNPETAEKAKPQPEDKNGPVTHVAPADDARIHTLEVAVENQTKALADLIAALTPKTAKVVDQTAAASHAPVVEAKKQ